MNHNYVNLVSVIAVVDSMCVCVCVYVRVCVALSEALSGSCAVWMLRPLSAACRDVASFVRYPVFHE